MNCPYCNSSDTKVFDSRETKDNLSIRRKRECSKCQKRFLTIETISKLELEVKKQNEKIEPFDLDKIKKSLLKCCEKRPVTLEDIQKLLDKILNDIKKIKSDLIDSSKIGKIVLKNLKELDEIAFVKYYLVYNKYDSLKDFIEEVKNLKSFK